ncbi:MAG: hypothetical protein WCS70_01665 [Verrucomicrobiota bacterium]
MRIKRPVLNGRYEFSDKARSEMTADRLTENDVVECIVNAIAIYKTLRSTSPDRHHTGERLYDRDAMRKIEAHSPAYAKTHAGHR